MNVCPHPVMVGLIVVLFLGIAMLAWSTGTALSVIRERVTALEAGCEEVCEVTP